MKRVSLIISIVMMFSLSVTAQGNHNPEMIKRLKVEKIAFLAKRLQLTPQEAQAFWPVYNEFERKRLALEKERHQVEDKIEEKQSLSNEELTALCENYIQSHEKEAQLFREYNTKFLKVIPVNKVVLLYQSEVQFRSHMLHEFRQRGRVMPPKQ